MHCWLSVQTCCCSLLAWGEQRYQLQSSATVFFKQRGLCNACHVETHREAASKVPRWKTELIFQVRFWGCCPSLQADSEWGLSNAVGLLLFLSHWDICEHYEQGSEVWQVKEPRACGSWGWGSSPPSCDYVLSSPVSCLWKWFRSSRRKVLQESKVIPDLVLCSDSCVLLLVVRVGSAFLPDGKALSLPLRPCSSEHVGTGLAAVLWISGLYGWTRKCENTSDLSTQLCRASNSLHPSGYLSASQGCWALAMGVVLEDQDLTAHIGAVGFSSGWEPRISSMASNCCSEAGTTGLIWFGLAALAV